MDTSDEAHPPARTTDAGPRGVGAAGPAQVRRLFRVPDWLDVAAAWSWRLLLVAAALGGVVWVARSLTLVLVPIVVGLVAAAVLSPVVDRAARVLPRVAATWSVILAGAVVVVGAAVLLSTAVLGEADGLSAELSAGRQEVREWLVDGPLERSPDQVAQWEEAVDDAVARTLDRLWEDAGSLAGRALEFAAGAVLAVALVFFLVKDGAAMFAWSVGHLAPERRATVRRSGLAAAEAIRGWIRGVVVAGVVDGVLIGLGLVVLGVPAALPLAVLTFLGAFLPLVGATVAGLLAGTVALATGGVSSMLAVGVLVLVVQQVEGNVVLPLVMKRQVRLHPAVVLVALAAGGVVAGVVGALLAIPLAAAATAAVAEVGPVRVPAGPAGDGTDDARLATAGRDLRP